MSEAHKTCWRCEVAWFALSLMVGSVFAYLILPDLVTSVTNINNLNGDEVQHYIGWAFFRTEKWSFPLTLSSHLMYPFGMSVAFTDSYPLLTLPLKLLQQWLPTPFVWHGLAAIINSSLMFYAGLVFFRGMRGNIFLALIGAAFLLFASPLVWRYFGHFSLTAQWLLVINLYLIVKPRVCWCRDILAQVIILILSCATHPYLAFMNLLLAFALAAKYYVLTRNVASQATPLSLIRTLAQARQFKVALIAWLTLSLTLSSALVAGINWARVKYQWTDTNGQVQHFNLYYQVGLKQARPITTMLSLESASQVQLQVAEVEFMRKSGNTGYNFALNQSASFKNILQSQYYPLVKASLDAPTPGHHRNVFSLVGAIIGLTVALVSIYSLTFIGLAYAMQKLLLIYREASWQLDWRKCQALVLSVGFGMVVVLSGWILGWYTNHTASGAGGFGTFSSNVLSLINPMNGSILLPSIPVGSGQYEGAAYLGLGIILPLAWLIVIRRNYLTTTLQRSSLEGLLWALGICWFFALSNKLQIANFSLDLPYGGECLGTFRSSGRFIWPVFYALTLWVILKVYDYFASKKLALWVLSGLLLIQVCDNWSLMRAVRTNLLQATTYQNWQRGLVSNQWFKLKENGYQHISLISNAPSDWDWQDPYGYMILYKFALLAIENQVTINDAYLARRSTLIDDYLRSEAQNLVNGKLATATLYIVNPQFAARHQIQAPCEQLDGYLVCGQNLSNFLAANNQ